MANKARQDQNTPQRLRREEISDGISLCWEIGWRIAATLILLPILAIAIMFLIPAMKIKNKRRPGVYVPARMPRSLSSFPPFMP